MNKLVIVRHAKSSWEYNLEDYQRPLKSRGIEDANLVSDKFKSLNKILNKILS